MKRQLTILEVNERLFEQWYAKGFKKKKFSRDLIDLGLALSEIGSSNRERHQRVTAKVMLHEGLVDEYRENYAVDSGVLVNILEGVDEWPEPRRV